MSLELIFELAGLFCLFLAERKLLLHLELLALLLDQVSTVEGEELLLDVLQKSLLLLPRQAFVFVALLDFFLALFDALAQVRRIRIKFFLHFLLAPQHVVEVAVLVLEVILELVLHSLLLKLNVAESAFLILLLLPLVLVERLLVRSGFTVGQSLVPNQLHSHLALLSGHLGAEVHLFGRVFLFQLLPQRGLLVLVGIVQLEVDFSKQVFFVETQFLESVLVSLLGNRVLHLFKFVLVNLEVLLDGVLLGMHLVGVFVQHQLE